ncbi:MAG: hypothetical protein NUV50_06545 [Rhodospirillales bacterium]|nr:hypothetical protein [Rhodospirillales bacterium]
MTTLSDTLNVPVNMPMADATLLNAKRYGLTEKHLSQFAELMNSVKKQTPDVPDDATKDGSEISTTDLIKDYIRQRMTDRLSASMSDERYLGAFSPDAMANPQDLILDMVGNGRPRNPSSDLSGLLNMHFDLHTLQMFS